MAQETHEAASVWPTHAAVPGPEATWPGGGRVALEEGASVDTGLSIGFQIAIAILFALLAGVAFWIDVDDARMTSSVPHASHQDHGETP